jgi:hypothetical protein
MRGSRSTLRVPPVEGLRLSRRRHGLLVVKEVPSDLLVRDGRQLLLVLLEEV